MKINIYILLILTLSFSLGNAQSTEAALEVKTSNSVSVSNEDVNTVVVTEINTVKENDSLLIDAETLKGSIARTASDIRIYLNRKRKVSNIKLLFPKINKAIKA
ncbi:hypothetical protein GCM10023311_22590 [Flaviramulus aquimarinus]|uniref:Auto-transporter adhesin head GIN domain-containing protein n=1 Tax=Flaviramulus aquimarinus TaxID=1170456 RepID=A0ABP9FJ76_9FLAO